MNHKTHISNLAERLRRISLASMVAVFSLTASVTGGYTLLTAGIAQAATAAPTNVKVLTGGNNIGITWAASTGSIAKYEVWRNSVKIATVTPGQGVLNGDLFGTRYVDTNVTAGTTYSYQVDAVGTDTTVSPLTTAIAVTQPAAGSTTAVPTITLDTSGGTDLASYMQNTIVPYLQTWYPKLGDAFAYPSYTPTSAFTIQLAAPSQDNPNITALADTNWNTQVIRIDPTWLRNNQAAGGGLLLHETMHILQKYSIADDPTGWFKEGSADFAGEDYIAHDRNPIPPLPNDRLTDGYWIGSYFLNYLQTTYDPAIVRKLNIAIHNNTYTTAYFQSLTGGKTDAQAFSDMRANLFSASAPVRTLTNKCAQAAPGQAAIGAAGQIATCSGSTAQQWGLVYMDAVGHDLTKGFRIANSSIADNNGIGTDNSNFGNYCLDVYGNASTDGTQVVQWRCVNLPEQQFKAGANGSLVHMSSGKCLQPVNGGSADGTGLEIRTCNASAAQNWSYSTTNSAIDQRYASDQTFRTNLGYPTAAEVVSGIFSYKTYSNNGRAYNTTRSGVHEVHGMIGQQYVTTGAHTSWGEPTTDEKPTPDGVGRFNEFYGAGTSGVVSIYWSPSTNAHVVHGTIRDQWGSTGWEAGAHGYPVSDEAPTPNGLARFNTFQNGGIYWSSSTGARSVLGAIYAHWGALGYENSFEALPVTSETATPDGIGRFNQFQNGFIYWSPSTGAWEVHGAIQARWSALGWEHSYLGYPTSDEFSITGGKRNNFQNGYITWNASTGVVNDYHY